METQVSVIEELGCNDGNCYHCHIVADFKLSICFQIFNHNCPIQTQLSCMVLSGFDYDENVAVITMLVPSTI